MPRAMRKVPIRIIFLYVIGSLCVGIVTAYNDPLYVPFAFLPALQADTRRKSPRWGTAVCSCEPLRYIYDQAGNSSSSSE